MDPFCSSKFYYLYLRDVKLINLTYFEAHLCTRSSIFSHAPTCQTVISLQKILRLKIDNFCKNHKHEENLCNIMLMKKSIQFSQN